MEDEFDKFHHSRPRDAAYNSSLDVNQSECRLLSFELCISRSTVKLTFPQQYHIYNFHIQLFEVICCSTGNSYIRIFNNYAVPLLQLP